MLRFLRLTLGFTLLVLLSTPHTTIGQQAALTKVDFSSIKVDNLSDEQVKQFITRAKTTGMTMTELEGEAISRGMPYSEALKLRERIKTIESGISNTANQPTASDTRTMDGELSQREDYTEDTDQERDSLKVFGYDLFNRSNLTFEPSLNIPTPKNYQLGAGDELIIEVWGASQSQQQLTVSPEGQINIPNVGPVRVGGLTIEKATNLIINRLSAIYSGLKGTSPNTFAQVSIGNIRSIKVTITGDVYTPGTYTLPSFASAFNGLYLAGGPNNKGSFREISVIRNGETYKKIDLYDFLVKGQAKLNVRLQDEDIIFVASYQNHITMDGEVIRPAIYEMKKGETLEELINFAGGFSSKAYNKNLVVNRKTESQRKLLNVNKELFSSFMMNNGDEVVVGEILDRYENRVTIKGAVFREGEYSLKEGMTITSLINLAEGLREDAFTSRASIYRLRDNLEVEVIDFDLKSILENSSPDLQLKREDLLVISSILELKQERTVSIMGQVQNPGEVLYADNISLGELIRKAGGLKHSASLAKVEVARRIQDRNTTESDEITSEVFNFSIDEDLSISNQGSSFILKPFDIVFVRTSPGYKEQELAVAEGEFVFPGEYAIAHKGERISDLVTRAGGLTPEAYLPGATLLRKIDDTQREQTERIKDLEGDGLEINVDTKSQLNNSHQPIGINLHKILKNPKSNEDLLLVEGDILRVPQQLQTVRLSGELLNPTTTRYTKNTSLRNYISQGGGFTDKARKNKVFVIYANGTVNRTRSFLGFKRYPKIHPGAEIIVPQKPERDGISMQETLAISSSLSSIALVTISIINQLSKE